MHRYERERDGLVDFVDVCESRNGDVYFREGVVSPAQRRDHTRWAFAPGNGVIELIPERLREQVLVDIEQTPDGLSSSSPFLWQHLTQPLDPLIAKFRANGYKQVPDIVDPVAGCKHAVEHGDIAGEARCRAQIESILVTLLGALAPSMARFKWQNGELSELHLIEVDPERIAALLDPLLSSVRVLGMSRLRACELALPSLAGVEDLSVHFSPDAKLFLGAQPKLRRLSLLQPPQLPLGEFPSLEEICYEPSGTLDDATFVRQLALLRAPKFARLVLRGPAARLEYAREAFATSNLAGRACCETQD